MTITTRPLTAWPTSGDGRATASGSTGARPSPPSSPSAKARGSSATPRHLSTSRPNNLAAAASP
eukprot:409086-Pyramimonas_sp.AAC.1